jgi:hypothetical protein
VHSGSRRVKAVHRMLMKLNPGVNIINVLLANLCLQISKAKKTDNLTTFGVLLGSGCVKAVHKHVGEIDTWLQFHQNFTLALFRTKVLCTAFLLNYSLAKEYLCKSCKMLMKLTTDGLCNVRVGRRG